MISFDNYNYELESKFLISNKTISRNKIKNKTMRIKKITNYIASYYKRIVC